MEQDQNQFVIQNSLFQNQDDVKQQQSILNKDEHKNIKTNLVYQKEDENNQIVLLQQEEKYIHKQEQVINIFNKYFHTKNIKINFLQKLKQFLNFPILTIKQSQIEQSQLLILLSLMKNLQEIVIIRCFKITTINFQSIKNLKKIGIKFSKIQNILLINLPLLQEIILPRQKQFKSLKIINCFKLQKLDLTSTSVKYIHLQSLINLDYLILINCKKIEQLTLIDLKKIKALYLSQAQLSINCIKLDSLDNLNYVRFKSCQELHSLEISNCYKLDNIGNLPQKLCQLKLYKINGLTKLQMQNFRKLKKLNITKCEMLKDINFENSTLNTHEFNEILNKNKSFQNINVLKMKGCKKIQFFRLQQFKNLRILNLNDTSIKSLFLKNLCQLEELYLQNCKSLKAIQIRQCNMIKIIQITYSPIVYLSQLLNQLPQLKKLILKDCLNVEIIDLDLTKCLRRIQLSNITINKINKENLQDIQFIYMSKCKFFKSSLLKQFCFIDFSKLKVLKLKENKINSIQPLIHINFLYCEQLDLSDNQICSVKSLKKINYVMEKKVLKMKNNSYAFTQLCVLTSVVQRLFFFSSFLEDKTKLTLLKIQSSDYRFIQVQNQTFNYKKKKSSSIDRKYLKLVKMNKQNLIKDVCPIYFSIFKSIINKQILNSFIVILSSIKPINLSLVYKIIIHSFILLFIIIYLQIQLIHPCRILFLLYFRSINLQNQEKGSHYIFWLIKLHRYPHCTLFIPYPKKICYQLNI